MTDAERVPEPELDPEAGRSEPDQPDVTASTGAEDPALGMPAPTGIESLVGALLEAGPDVAEHVVRAAQELLLAVQAIVDAADRAVQEQQRIQAEAERVANAAANAGATDAGATDDAPPATVHHLDIAE